MEIANSSASQEFVGQPPWFHDEEADGGEKFRVPIQKRIENIDNHVSKRPAIIDRRLPALRAMRTDQFGAAIFAMGQWQRLSLFASPKPTSAGSSLDRGNGSVPEDNFCGLVRHDGQDYEMACSASIGERTTRLSRSWRLRSSANRCRQSREKPIMRC